MTKEIGEDEPNKEHQTHIKEVEFLLSLFLGVSH